MSKVTKSVIMSAAHYEIYRLNIYMQEIKSSFKLNTSENSVVAILFLHLYSSDYMAEGKIEAQFFSKSYWEEV